MQISLLGRLSDLTLAVRRQVLDLRQVWNEDKGARHLVLLAVAGGVSVVLLAMLVDVLRYLDLHHYRARFLSLTTDRGLPELVMDVLVLIASALTAHMFVRTRLRGYLFVTGLLLFVALDDFFSFHESIGVYLAERLSLTDIGGIGGDALGELTFMALLGLMTLPFLLWAVLDLRSENLAVLVIYGLLFTGFVGLSAGLDALHATVQSSFMDRLMGWIEDGGEILIITAISAVTILLWRSCLRS